MKAIRYFGTCVLALLALQACSMTPQKGDSAPQQGAPGAMEQQEGTDSSTNGEASDQVSESEFPDDEGLTDELQTDVPPHVLYQLLVAEIAGQRGDLGLAVKNYVDVAKETSDPRVTKRATQIAMFAKDYESALEVGRFWVKIAPQDADARRNLASVYLRLARPADAVKQYEEMLQLVQDESRPGNGFSVIASQLAREPDRELAMGVMDKLVEKRKDNPYALFAQSHLAMRQARFEKALNILDQALEVKPDWPAAVILRSRILAMQGSREDALNYLKKMLDGNMSDNLEVGLTYARMLTEAREMDKALDQFIRLADLDSKNVEINYYAGVLALQLEKLDKAEKYLEKVLKMGKRVQETNYYLGQVAEHRGKLKKAINRYSFVRYGEFYFSAQLRIVSILADQKKFDQARQQLQTIRTNSSKQRLQLILLEGDILREAKRYPDAKEFYTKVLSTMPDETSIRYARALVAEKMGELDLAESDLQAILKKEPSNAQVLNALGYTLADRTDRYEEALKYIQRAIELEPDDAAVVDSMGWVNYRLGNHKKAIKHLRRAVELSDDPEIAAHLGEVLWVSGKKKEALKVWEGSLDKHPNDPKLMDVMKRFGL
ncbi:MAG: tetratricopeptide repeat protein [Gammaproteobacteria bacterium]